MVANDALVQVNVGRRLGAKKIDPVFAPLRGRSPTGTVGTGCPQLPVAEQLFGATQPGGSVWPPGTRWQVPAGTPPLATQWTQTLLHAVLQQTPSTQKLEAHDPLVPQGCPFFSVQVPAALQMLVPEQVGGSSALTTAVQTPRLPGRPQLRHDAVHELLQQ